MPCRPDNASKEGQGPKAAGLLKMSISTICLTLHDALPGTLPCKHNQRGKKIKHTSAGHSIHVLVNQPQKPGWAHRLVAEHLPAVSAVNLCVSAVSLSVDCSAADACCASLCRAAVGSTSPLRASDRPSGLIHLHRVVRSVLQFWVPRTPFLAHLPASQPVVRPTISHQQPQAVANCAQAT
jgi:hypothetical protein